MKVMWFVKAVARSLVYAVLSFCGFYSMDELNDDFRPGCIGWIIIAVVVYIICVIF